MTNILKDVVGGPAPRRVLAAAGGVRRRWASISRGCRRNPQDARFDAGMRELVGVAHAHLRNALDYTLLIPGTEAGIRRFCLWAVGLAVLTLQKITDHPGFTAGAQVKISRSAVAMTRVLADLAVRNDWLLRRLFAQAARGLPLARLSEFRRPPPAPVEANRGSADGSADVELAVNVPGHERSRHYGSSLT